MMFGLAPLWNKAGVINIEAARNMMIPVDRQLSSATKAIHSISGRKPSCPNWRKEQNILTS